MSAGELIGKDAHRLEYNVLENAFENLKTREVRIKYNDSGEVNMIIRGHSIRISNGKFSILNFIQKLNKDFVHLIEFNKECIVPVKRFYLEIFRPGNKR